MLRKTSLLFAASFSVLVALTRTASADGASPASDDIDAQPPAAPAASPSSAQSSASAASPSPSSAPSAAAASPSPSSAPSAAAPVRAEKQWYGWETLLVDGASMAAFYGGGSKTPALSYIGLGGYALGAPAVHLARGRTDVALADLGVRVAAPIVFAAIGYGIDMSSSSPCDGGDFCFRGVGGLLVGAWLGHVTAVVLDAAVFAVEPARRAPETPDEARAEPPRPRLVPSLAIGPQGASAGVGGTF